MQTLQQSKKAIQQGFTLIELMIVVAIIGIIASIALPSYKGYVQRSKVAEATTNLSDMRVRLEQYYQDKRTYEGADDDGGPCDRTDKIFDYACTLGASAYTITATGKTGGDVSAFEFTINETNAKTSKYDGVEGATCWLTSKTDTCPVAGNGGGGGQTGGGGEPQ